MIGPLPRLERTRKALEEPAIPVEHYSKPRWLSQSIYDLKLTSAQSCTRLVIDKTIASQVLFYALLSYTRWEKAHLNEIITEQ